MKNVTCFRYHVDYKVPLVPALLVFQKQPLLTQPINFAVDTAATRTIITPQSEAVLKVEAPEIPWDDLFRHGDARVDTIMGEAVFKSLQGEVGLMFRTEAGRPWKVRLDSLLFCDETKLGHAKIIPGKLLPFSLLGQDVLRKCLIASATDGGFLCGDPGAVKRIDQVLEQLRARA